MLKKAGSILFVLFLVLTALGMPYSAVPVSADQDTAGNLFVKQAGPELRLNGKIFRFAGTNNYYLMYKSRFMVDDVLQAAAGSGFSVIRLWGSLDIGNQDGSNSIQGKADGVYFQYWDGTQPAYNDGTDGLQHLDYVLYRAGQLGLKVVIPFVNNWSAFGGMDQYVRWRGGQFHDDFYTDPMIRTWFKNWIAHLLNRTNTYTGVQYKNDPTIMTWELANEPRCIGSGVYPRSSACDTQTLIAWADDISHFIKRVDGKHLISVGDEGFYCIPGATDWTENCGEGVDTLAFARLEKIDVMSFHLYPDGWGKDAAWGTAWIQRHFADARELHKPAMLGEFGLLDKTARNTVYKQWTDAVFQSGGSGALYWILSGKQDDGSLYADYDGFTVYCPSPVCTTLGNFSQMMKANKALVFPPVADNLAAVTEFETPVTLNPAASAVAYGGASVAAGSLDLDPAATGQQTTAVVNGGEFALQPDGNVLFMPQAGYAGKAQVSYTLQDSQGRLSNIAALQVTVKPNPSAAVVIESFEYGVDGWAAANWNDAGTVSQSSFFRTDGNYGLEVLSTNGGWFGVLFSPPYDLTGRTHVKIDVQTLGAGTSTDIAVQLGDSWTWCQGTFGWINPNTTATVDLDLIASGCNTADLNKVQALYIYFSGGGTYYIDDVRAE
jgi:mannan endo-1,4-beta-mannosidase